MEKSPSEVKTTRESGRLRRKTTISQNWPPSVIESGSVMRTTRKSDRIVDKVVRARFEIDRSRESRKTGLRRRFRRDSTIENASQRRIIALGTSNEAKRRPNRQKNVLERGPEAKNAQCYLDFFAELETSAKSVFRSDPAEEFAVEVVT